MAWIQSHQELGSHPKLRKLAALLGIGRPQAVGHCTYLWWWCLDYADDGSLARFDAVDIALAAEWDGDAAEFVEALVRSGFLDRSESGLVVHDWLEYAGRLIERRRADADRKRAVRGTSVGHPADVQRTARGQERTSSGRLLLREEKSREEKSSDRERANARSQPAPAPIPKRKPATTKYDRSFRPSESTLAWARGAGWQGDAFDHEFEKFADYFVAKGTRYADWDQALVNWLKKAAEFNQAKVVPIRANGAGGRGAAYDEFVAGLDQILTGENA